MFAGISGFVSGVVAAPLSMVTGAYASGIAQRGSNALFGTLIPPHPAQVAGALIGASALAETAGDTPFATGLKTAAIAHLSFMDHR